MLNEASMTTLQMKLRGQLVRPQDADYDEARAIWNGMIDRRPGLIIRCAGVADVIEAVSFARENELLVAVRGGGHNIAGTSVCEGGLMIDLSAMNGVDVDPKARTVRVQGGATLADLDRATQEFALATPGGVVSSTGVGGLTLGGGFGWLSRKYGLAIDNLLAVEVVTAAGQRVTASAGENPDLFWGLRGGSGNFGSPPPSSSGSTRSIPRCSLARPCTDSKMPPGCSGTTASSRRTRLANAASGSIS